MKNKHTAALMVSLLIPLFAGCNNDADKLSLYRESYFYSESNNEVVALPLATYRYKNEGDVPYVSLKEFLPILKTIEKSAHNKEIEISYTSEGGVYTIDYAPNKEHKITHPFVFDEKNQTVTIDKEAKVFYSMFYDYEPNIDGMEQLCQRVDDKDEDIHYVERRVIDLKKYDLRIVEFNDNLYAPIDLYQIIFKLSFAPTGNNHITYNGIDYFSDHGSGVVASCYSSELKFAFQEPNLLMTAITLTSAVSGEVSFLFSPVTPVKEERYRFESPVIQGGEFTVRATGEKIIIPDLFLRIALNKDGSGKYVYVNNQTKEEFEEEKGGLINNKTMTFTEDNDYLHLKMSYPNPFLPDNPMEASASINKNKTFYLEEKRSKEYALYDFKIVSLYLGEFYGLVESNPKVRDSVNFLKPYKDKITSTDFHDYHLAMSEMALSGIDDGHTKVLGFSKFSQDKFDSEENAAALEDMVGPRRSSLFALMNAYEAGRKAAGLDKGYEVVGDTAYLAFDDFVATPGKTLDKYVGNPNDFVGTDTVGFAYLSMQDVSNNHPEVTRVVFDLSCNTGGMVIALPFLVGLMKREFNINVFNYYVDALCRRYYQIDLNGNGVFGEEEDTYEGEYDFYVLTSDLSFSCGNAFPGVAKYNKAAKIVGKQSAGGASGVDYFTSPSGFELRCSSCMTQAFMLEDGSFIENDGGIPVDYEIAPELWYNRTALNTELDRMKK